MSQNKKSTSKAPQSNERHQNDSESASFRTLPSYNTPPHKGSERGSEEESFQTLPAYNTPHHKSRARGSEGESFQTLPAYNTPHHKSCVRGSDHSQDDSDSTSFRTLPSYREKYSAFDETRIQVNKNGTIPIIEAKSEKYTPIPYVFRVTDNSNQKSIKTMVRCPPFHVQLDHTIAVVWSLYAADETDIPIGINQLHWAYCFLQNVKEKDSTHPKDIEHCLNSITDELIEQYAELAEDSPTPQSSTTSFNPQAHSTRTDIDDGDGDTKTCPCGSTVRFADEVDTCSGSTNSASCSRQPDYPFSVTYNDMLLHNSSMDSNRGNKTKDICNRDDSTVNSFLDTMRKDQLKKILDELDRLHSIEKYIGNTDKDFIPYLNDDDRELQELIELRMDCTSDACGNKKDKEKQKTSKDSSKKSTPSQSEASSTRGICRRQGQDNADDEELQAEDDGEFYDVTDEDTEKRKSKQKKKEKH